MFLRRDFQYCMESSTYVNLYDNVIYIWKDENYALIS